MPRVGVLACSSDSLMLVAQVLDIAWSSLLVHQCCRDADINADDARCRRLLVPHYTRTPCKTTDETHTVWLLTTDNVPEDGSSAVDDYALLVFASAESAKGLHASAGPIRAQIL